jgi:hypothetical protein
MSFTSPETKWNADDQKITLLMEIEAELEEGFITKDIEKIFDYIGAYRRQTYPKFINRIKNEIDKYFIELENLYITYRKNRRPEDFNRFYTRAEHLFLYISQKVKEAGIYFREGRSASTAVLER